MDLVPADLLHELVRAAIELAPRVGSLPRYVLAPIVWAYAVADARHVEFLRACARRAEVIFDGRGGAPSFEEVLRQIVDRYRAVPL